jgi:hypothetical protein
MGTLAQLGTLARMGTLAQLGTLARMRTLAQLGTLARMRTLAQLGTLAESDFWQLSFLGDRGDVQGCQTDKEAKCPKERCVIWADIISQAIRITLDLPSSAGAPGA